MASESYSLKIRARQAKLDLDEKILARMEKGGAPDTRRRTMEQLRAHIAFEKLAIQVMQYDS